MYFHCTSHNIHVVANRERVMWLLVSNNDLHVESDVLFGVDLWIFCGISKAPRLTQISEEQKAALLGDFNGSRSGILKYGRRYIVYLFILYHDDFNRSSKMKANNSVSCFYLLRLCLPYYMRFSTASTIVISLITSGLQLLRCLCILLMI